MAKFSVIVYLMVVFAVAAHLMVEPSEALTCSDINSSVGPCSGYATGTAAQPSGACCAAVQRLNSMAKTTADRRQMCSCLKQSAASFPNVRLSNIASIPQKCGVSGVSFSADPNFNCNAIN